MARKFISKRTRFAVLARDSFKCQYCGTDSRDDALVVDHIVPVARGGGSEPSNGASTQLDDLLEMLDGRIVGYLIRGSTMADARRGIWPPISHQDVDIAIDEAVQKFKEEVRNA